MNLPVVVLCGQAGSGKDTVGKILQERCNAVLLAQADPMKRFARALFEFPVENLWGPSESREAVVDVNPVPMLVAKHHLDWLLTELDWDGPRHETEQGFERWYDGQVALAAKTPQPRLAARGFLQTLGTEFGRDTLDENVWNQHALTTARRLLRGGWIYDRLSGLTKAPAPPARMVGITDGRFLNEVVGAREVGAVPVLVTGRSSAIVGNATHKSETESGIIPGHFFAAILDNNGTLKDLEDMVRDVVDEHFGITRYQGRLDVGRRSMERLGPWADARDAAE